MTVRADNGNIHTVQLVTDMEEMPAQPTDSRISSIYRSTGDGRIRLRVRADKGETTSNQTGARLFYGECENLADYRQTLAVILQSAGIVNAHEIRVDFKIDCRDIRDAGIWTQYGNLLIDCFIAKHGIGPKHQNYTTTAISGEHKSTSAETKTMGIIVNNKRVQQPKYGACYRLELHHLQTEGLTVEKALRQWQKELKALKAYYHRACEMRNDALTDSFTKEPEKVRLSQFLLTRRNRIYCREQVRELYQMVGKTRMEAITATRNYCNRIGKGYCLFVTRKDFCAYIDSICEQIDRFIQPTEMHQK